MKLTKIISTFIVLSIFLYGYRAFSLDQTIYLVRHGEKSNFPDMINPQLSDQGQLRAKKLGDLAIALGVNKIYASEFTRTKQTVQVAATNLNLDVTVRKAGHEQGLVEEINKLNELQTILIAGHSNTVPVLIELLGGPTDIVINEDEFDNLFVLVIKNKSTKLIQLKY